MHISKRSAMRSMIALAVSLTYSHVASNAAEVIKAQTQIRELGSKTRCESKDPNSTSGNRVSQAKRRKYARQGRA